MPARKSNNSASGVEDGAAREGFGVEDLSLPRTMVQRLAKGVLPANTQIQKDALLAMSKSATVFVNYLSASANENASRANKKTIQPRDVFGAVHDLEFDAFLPRLEAELIKYNTVQCDKRNTYRRKVREDQLAAKAKAAKEALAGPRPDGEADGEQIEARADGEEPAAKKVRRSSVDGGDAEAVDEGDDDVMEQDEDEQDEEENDAEDDDDVDDDDDDGEDEHGEEQLVEDPLEQRETEGIGDDASDGDGDDSD